MLAADQITQFLYWATDGRLGEKQLSYSMLLLHAIGRKTGKRRTHALIYFRDGDNLVVCASNNGSPQPPAWYLNLQATPPFVFNMDGYSGKSLRRRSARRE